MARRLTMCFLVSTISLVATNLPSESRLAVAQEAAMDAKGEAQAKEALRLYKQGRYQEAAEVFAKLSVDYPDLLVFGRNLGACYYYLRRPEPALSNLRHYLSRKQNIEPNDKATIEGWISEMEKLRERNAAAVVQLAPPTANEPVVVAHPSTETDSSLTKPVPTAPSAPPPPESPKSGPVPSAPSFTPPESAAKPAALDVTSTPTPTPAAEQGSPLHTKWWFWGTIGVVAAGAVTAYLVATRSGTENACAGGSLPCDAIR